MALFLVFMLSGLGLAEVFKITSLGSGPKKETAIDKASGQQLWQTEIKVVKFNLEGKPFIYITDNGSGIYGKDKTFKSWTSASYYRYDGTTAIPYQGKLVYKDKSGKVIQTIEKSYDPEHKTVLYKDNGKDTIYEYRKELIDRELLGTAISNYPFDKKRDFVFRLLTNEPRIYPMTLKFIGEEALKVGGKTVDCYKIQMIPDLGVLNLLGAFVPKTYFWETKSEPHDFVRYEGLESGLGTPYIVIQTVD